MIRSQDFKSKAVQLYTKAGITLFPCKPNKTPLEYGWQQTEFDKSLTAEDLPEIFGVLLTDELFVLDVDTRRYDDDAMNFDDLMEMFEIETPVDTFVVKTGGGAHVYFKCPPGRKYKMYVPGTGKAIECKSLGRYVIAAGSIHPKTQKPYMVLRGSLNNLMEAPEALLKYCEQVKADSSDDEENTDDSEANQNRFIKFCTGTDAAYEGNRNTQCYIVAARAHDYGLSANVCFEIMSEYYNSNRVKPKLSKSELRDVIEHAYEYAQSGKGHNAISLDSDEIPLAGGFDDADESSERDDGEIENTKSDIRSKRRRLQQDDNDSDAGLDVSNSDSKRLARLQMGQYGWDPILNKEGVQLGLKPTVKNLVNFLICPTSYRDDKTPNPLKDLVGFNELSHRIEFTKIPPWRDQKVATFSNMDYVQMKFWMATRREINFSSEVVEEAVVIAAMDNKFNPLVDFIDTLEWDGVKRLDTWLQTYCGADDNDYVRTVGRITLISAIARGYEPGCKVDTMMILEGPQGQGKGTLVEILGGKFATSMHLHLQNEAEHKKTIMRMLGRWIIELPEMTHTRKQEIEAVKAFLTTRIDNVVLPWGKNAEDLKRSSIFIGTFNPTSDGAYLNDATGNRRYLPVRTRTYDLKGFREVRDQLLAEAKAAYLNGEKWHITNKEILAMAEKEQSARTVKEVWVERIEEYLQEYEGEHKFSNLHLTRVVVGSHGKASRTISNRIGVAMRALGYFYKDFKEHGKTQRYWVKEKKMKE